MSERMTDEALSEMRRKSGLSTHDCAEAFDELDRARAEEARLLGVVKKQEERIRRLESLIDSRMVSP